MRYLKITPSTLPASPRANALPTASGFWGQGSKPMLPSFEATYGVKGSVISAVDLLKGIGKCAGMDTPEVPGATGYIDTNFKGKAQAAVDALASGKDFVYIHIEALMSAATATNRRIKCALLS